MTLIEIPRIVIHATAVVLGLIWGSFINVVIHRVPRGLSIVRPRSHCPSCQTPIAWYNNIPVLSYLLLRGRARCCGAGISPRYPLVELISGMTALAIVDGLLWPHASSLSLGRASALFTANLIFALGLTAAAFIDLEHMYLPDSITLGGIVLGIGTSSLRGLSYRGAIVGALFGFTIVWVPFDLLYKKIRGRAGMGLGDAKLLALAGAWFTWKGALFALFAGAVQGTIVAAFVYVIQGAIQEPKAVHEQRRMLEQAAALGDYAADEMLRHDPIGAPPLSGFGSARIPFGPFLVIACLEWLFWGDQLLECLS